MAEICPSITEINANPHDYRSQIEKVEGFADRIHIDLMDGEFAPSRSINPIQVWWPDGITADIHIMFARPLEHLETLVSLKPNMVIIHAEAEGDLKGMMEHLQKLGIKAGICLLKDTQPYKAEELVRIADHVLLFSGDLGHFGGKADLGLLGKVSKIKEINPNTEIGWDGGANESNVKRLADGGVDAITVGGAIQNSENPETTYATLVEKLQI